MKNYNIYSCSTMMAGQLQLFGCGPQILKVDLFFKKKRFLNKKCKTIKTNNPYLIFFIKINKD
jgi:hypothetical protein